MADPISEMLLRQLNTNPTGIERWILLGVVRSAKFYRSIRKNVCARQADGRLRQDFLTPRYNSLYAVADRFWRLLDRQSLDQDMEVPRHLMETMLQDDLELGKLDAEEHALLIEEFNQFFYASAQVHPLLIKALMEPLKVWLSMRMATLAVNAAHLDGMTSQLSISKLVKTVGEFSKASSMEGQRVVSMQSTLDGRRTFYRRISSGITGLDLNLGGGYGRGEVALVAGANGSGKTVFGCQEAVEFARQGLKVGYFTTEQPPLDLTFRMLSNFTGVELRHLTNRAEMKELSRRDAVELANLPPLFQTDADAAAGLAVFREEIMPNIEFMDWADGTAPVVQDAFDSAMEALTERFGQLPDVVIFDWLGGAIERGKDKEHLRHHYYDAMNYIVNYTKAHPSMTTIVMAQIDKAKAEKAPVILMVHLAECKSLSDNITVFIGISSIKATRTEDGITLQAPAAIQTLNVDKARSGPQGSIRVLRLFERQKFGEVHCV